MKLSELSKSTAFKALTGDAEIARIEYSSRNVKGGEVFFFFLV